MEEGLGFIDAPKRLEEQRIEPATLGLEGLHNNYCATAAPKI